MTTDHHNIQTVRRRPARSGRVSFSDPVVLYNSSRRRIVLVPFFIPHNSGQTELAAKIVVYLKNPLGFTTTEDCSITLPEDSARALLKGLKGHLLVAGEPDDGEYILVRVSEGTADLRGHDPATIAEALTKALGQSDIIQHLQNTELSSQLVTALKSVIRLNEMSSAVAELREMLERGENNERLYQSWCERHSWAFGNAYVLRDEVREISPGDHLDIMLSTVMAGYRDIVELKRPDMEVLNPDTKHRNYYFSSETSKAIGQCHRYLDVLHEEAANGLRDHPEIVAYHPRATIVIGRSFDWPAEKLKALHGLNRRLSSVSLMTYDHLLHQGEHMVKLFGENTFVDEADSLKLTPDDLDDEIPF